MAQTLKDLQGWEVITTDENGNIINENSGRRGRKRGSAELTFLQQTSSGVKFGRGDSVIMNDAQTNTYSVYMIHEIRLNTLNNVVELWAFSYLRWFELKPLLYYAKFNPELAKENHSLEFYKGKFLNEVDKDEIYLTAELSEIWLKYFVAVADIMDEPQWRSLSREKIPDRDFYVRYMCEPTGDNFVSIDVKHEKQVILKYDPKGYEEHLKRISVPPVSSQTRSPKSRVTAKPKAENRSGSSHKPSVRDIKIEFDTENESDVDSASHSEGDSFVKLETETEAEAETDEDEIVPNGRHKGKTLDKKNRKGDSSRKSENNDELTDTESESTSSPASDAYSDAQDTLQSSPFKKSMQKRGASTAKKGRSSIMDESTITKSSAKPSDGKSLAKATGGESSVKPTDEESSAKPKDKESSAKPTDGESSAKFTDGKPSAESKGDELNEGRNGKQANKRELKENEENGKVSEEKVDEESEESVESEEADVRSEAEISEEESEMLGDSEEEVEIKKKRRGRPRKHKENLTENKARKLEKASTPTSKASNNNVTVRKFTKKNIARAKKKYTPFSKRFSSLSDIPDLNKLAEFNQSATDLDVAALENKLRSPQENKVVETIFSKIKKQLYSSHDKDEIVKSGSFQDYLPARENEFASIYLSLYSAIESGSATTVYIAGTPGVGKTLTVREVIKELQRSSDQLELPLFQYVEINGLKMVKPTDSYEVLWNKIMGERLTWGAAMESLEFFFNKVPKNKKRPVVVLLDELDALVTKTQDIMYNFFNWTTYENAKLIVIAVANTMDLPERQLGTKVSSRIGFTRIMFTGYKYEELKEIIHFRLKGLNDSFFYENTKTGTAYIVDSEEEKNEPLPPYIKKVQLKMSDDAIEIASRKVASVSGDARRALKVCKRATEIAEQHYMAKHGYSYDGKPLEGARGEGITDEEDANDKDGVQTVHISHIMKALNETINSQMMKFISNLSFTGKLFLCALLNLIKKTGLQEQQLGDIIDEIRLLIEMNTKNKFLIDISRVLFQQGSELTAEQLRIISWDFVINQLIDAGLIIKQSLKNEKISCVKLCISTEDVRKALEQDDDLKNL